MSRSRATDSYTRTQRRHLETVEEVKDIARERLMEDGVGGLSLRAIARDMGVVPSALYRYFPSHGHLLDALADDAAASMLDHVEQAIDARPEDDHVGRWLAGLRAYRTWVMAHVPGYSLNFGDLSSDRSGTAPPDAVVRQLTDLLGSVVARADQAGALGHSPTGVARRISAQLSQTTPAEGLSPRQINATALSAWSAVHGTVALEASGRLPDIGIATEDYFEAQLLGIARAVGFQVDDREPAVIGQGT